MNERLFGVKPWVSLVCCLEEYKRGKRLTGRQAGISVENMDMEKTEVDPTCRPHCQKTERQDWITDYTLGESNTSMITTNTARFLG